MPLSVEGVAKNETVFLHVDNRPFKEVLDELAKVTTSQWNRNKSGGFTLTRLNFLIDQAVENENRQRLEIARTWYGDQVQKQSSLTNPQLLTQYSELIKKARKEKEHDQLATQAKIINQAFLQPLYRECLRGISVATVAKLQRGERVVYSSSPTPRQATFSRSIQSEIKKLNQGLQSWRTALGRAKLEGISIPVDPAQYEYSYPISDRSNSTLPFTRPVKSVVLTFSGMAYDNTFPALSLVDNLGRVVSASWFDPLAMNRRTQNSILSLPELKHVALPELTSLAPAPPRTATKAFRQASNSAWQIEPGDLSESEIGTALAPYFDDPINHDFLSFGNQEFLSILGENLHRSVIACIPDDQYFTYDERDVGRFVNGGIGDSTSSRISDSWVEFFPNSPAGHWRNRGNREALARCAKEWRNRGKIPMRDFLQLTNGISRTTSRIQAFAQLIMPQARHEHGNSQTGFTDAIGMAGLLGSLTDIQQRTLLKGKTIPYRDLGSEQRKYCESILYGVVADHVIGGFPKDLSRWDPTLELPNGIDDGAGITAQIIDEKYLIAHDQDKPSSDDVRETMKLDARPERFNGQVLGCGDYARANRWMKFDFRTRRRFALKCYLTKGHYYCVDYYEPMELDKGQRLTVDQLPPRLVAKIVKENPSFNSRPIKYTKGGKNLVRWERYVEPKKKKKK